MLRRNTFQIRIPTDRAMRMQRVAQPHRPRVKARPAFPAPPRIDTQNAQNVIRGSLSARTPRACMFTDGAGHLADQGLRFHLFVKHRSMQGVRQETVSNQQPGTILVLGISLS